MPLRLNKLPAARKAIKPAIKRGNVRAAGFVADVERQLVPVDDGDLKDTIRVEESGPLTYRVLAGDPSASKADGRPVDYGPFVEFGTPESPAQPFVAPAAAAIDPGREVKKELKAALEGL